MQPNIATDIVAGVFMGGGYKNPQAILPAGPVWGDPTRSVKF